MACQLPITQTVPIEELALSYSFDFAALVSVLEKKSILSRAEVIAGTGILRGQANS